MGEDKPPTEKEKLDAEISRGLSVVKVKEVHKQIEDIEKLRRQATIKSVYERISLCHKTSNGIVTSLMELKEKSPNQKFDWKIADSIDLKRYIDTIMAWYESLSFDFQRVTNIKKEDFDRLFPKIEFNLLQLNQFLPT